MWTVFLAHKRIGHEALGLYLHLMFTARLQETNQVKANSEYLCRGLRIGKVKLRTLKALLHKLGLIEYVQRRNTNGQITEQYTKLKLFTEESLNDMLKAQNDHRDNSCPTRTNTVLVGQKTRRMVNCPDSVRPQMLKEKKKKYGDYVSLFESEYQKLVGEYGEIQTKSMIEKLDNYKGSKGKKYKSDYRAILSWVVESVEATPLAKNKTCPDCGKSYVGSLCNECGWSV